MSVHRSEPILSIFYNKPFLQKDSTRQALKKVSMVAGAVLLASALAPCLLASAPLLAKITIMKSAGALGCFLFARFIPKGEDHPEILIKRFNEKAVNAFQNLAAFEEFYEQTLIQNGIYLQLLNPKNRECFERIEPIYKEYAAVKRNIEGSRRRRIPLNTMLDQLDEASRSYNQKLNEARQ